jgi:hypothetical protein
LFKALSDPAHPFIEASEGLKTVSLIEKIYAASPMAVGSQIVASGNSGLSARSIRRLVRIS